LKFENIKSYSRDLHVLAEMNFM